MRETLIHERKNRGLTQAQVAKELGITRAYYGHIETGVRNPPLELAKKIADFFGKTIEDLFFNQKGNNSFPDEKQSA